MRHVDLGAPGDGPVPADPLGIRKRMGHLNARMEELCCDGLTVSCGMEEEDLAGWVKIRMPNLDGVRAAETLRRDYRIETCPVAEDGLIVFRVTEKVSFEDMDYVQGAVMELLYG